jgi:hypothetical protein
MQPNKPVPTRLPYRRLPRFTGRHLGVQTVLLELVQASNSMLKLWSHWTPTKSYHESSTN